MGPDRGACFMQIKLSSCSLLSNCFLFLFSISACYGQGSDVIAKDVYQALNESSYVNVIVMLFQPPSVTSSNVDSDEVKKNIDKLQEEVLATLLPADFKLSLKYKNIPALAGSLSLVGAKKLGSNQHVARIDLDVGGSGSESPID
jgi:hypothetical protein